MFAPGGPCDHGESVDDAAVRETFERLGLHLDGVDFRRVGPLDEHRVRNIFMCPIVYWQVCPQTPAMRVSTDVAAVRWVDIELCLLDPLHWRPKGHVIAPAQFIPLSETWRNRLGLNTVHIETSAMCRNRVGGLTCGQEIFGLSPEHIWC